MQNDESNYLESLKPKYKSTDLTEVELPETEPKKNNNNISDKEDENTNFLLDVSLIRMVNVMRVFYDNPARISINFPEILSPTNVGLIIMLCTNEMIFFLDEARNGLAKRR